MDATLRGIAGHRPQVAVHHRLAAHKQQVTDMIPKRDVDGLFGFIQGHTPPRLGIEFRTREPAKTAIRIADVRDGKLQIPRPAMLEDLADELERTFPGTRNRLGKIWLRLRK